MARTRTSSMQKRKTRSAGVLVSLKRKDVVTAKHNVAAASKFVQMSKRKAAAARKRQSPNSKLPVSDAQAETRGRTSSSTSSTSSPASERDKTKRPALRHALMLNPSLPSVSSNNNSACATDSSPTPETMSVPLPPKQKPSPSKPERTVTAARARNRRAGTRVSKAMARRSENCSDDDSSTDDESLGEIAVPSAATNAAPSRQEGIQDRDSQSPVRKERTHCPIAQKTKTQAAEPQLSAAMKWEWHQKLRRWALSQLQSASSLSELVASLLLVDEMHRDCSMHPSAQRLVDDAVLAGNFILSRLLERHFDEHKSKRRLRIKKERVIRNLLTSCSHRRTAPPTSSKFAKYWTQSTTNPNDLGGLGLTRVELGHVLSWVQKIMTQNREAVVTLRKQMPVIGSI